MTPLVFLVPDAFGSHLRDQDGRVWLDETALAGGGLARLGIANTEVTPDGVIAAMYRAIVEAFETAQFEVNAFDYDWRLSLQVTAGSLRAAVQAALADETREVHLVGHGAGGLLAVEAANDAALLRALTARQTKIIALGCPFGGSWDICRMISGSHPLPRMLDRIASQPAGTAVPILAGWPGLDECQPKRPAAVPDSVLPLLTTICGTGVPTPAADAVTEGERRFLFRAAGDGRVLVEDASVRGASSIVLKNTHAELISSDDAPKACLGELTKARVQVSMPASASDDQPARAREEAIPDTVTSIELIEAASGALARRIAVVFPLSVSVAHGHLRHARFPLVAGHYRGDTIVSAEAALDAALGGRLTRRLDLDMYPGPSGTVEIVPVPGGHPPGGIVIGLGDVGELTPKILSRLFSQAAVRYAMYASESPHVGAGWQSAAMSSLLVGADSGGAIGIADSIRSIVRGALDANRKLRASALWDRVRIDRIEFIELFEETAVKAAHVVNSLPQILKQELAQWEEVVSNPQLDVQQGGEFLRPAEDAYGGGWWRRVQVRAEKPRATPEAAGAPNALELVYTPLSDRARLQQSTSVQSLEQVSRLVASSMTQTGVDLKLSNTLFELLVPPRLKEGIRQGGDLILMVNAEAAQYPFELMADRTREEIIPLVSKCGLIRQLEGSDDTPPLESNTGREILVIGPPDVRGWRPLTGARAEADRVAALCRERGYVPTLLLDSSSLEVQTTVFASDARILHIAAHGQYSDDPLKSGVVIGDGEFFTTAHVRAMRTVPELVFLNCCHLGQLGSAASDRAGAPAYRYPALAASLAKGFMEAGVRAVIAAGWAVDDNAGLTFARAFYERFLAGELFGDAVREARKKTLEDHPNTSTWGAYQCYGSPEFRLRSAVTSERARSIRKPVSRTELIAALRSLGSRAGGAQGAELTAIAEEFKQRRDQVMNGRWNDGQTIAELAAVAGELEDFEQAIDLYREALNVAKALAPLTAVEQLANILGRQAPRLAVTKGSDAAVRAIALFDEALAWLLWLDTKLKPTPERLALRGSLHKRWAMLTSDRERRKHLRSALAGYQQAREQSGKSSYHLLNWLALRYLLESRRQYGELVQLARAEWDRAQQSLAGNPEPAFWDRVAIPDALLHATLFEGSITLRDRAIAITAAYQNVLMTGPSARERASVRDHLQFLAEMLSDPDLKRQSAPSAALQPFLDVLA